MWHAQKKTPQSKVWDSDLWFQYQVPILNAKIAGPAIIAAERNYQTASSLAKKKSIPQFPEIISLPISFQEICKTEKWRNR